VSRAAALLLALLLAAAGAAAEVVRSQGEGTAPLPGAPGTTPRAAALEQALANAVRRVADELLGAAPGPVADAAIEGALGPAPQRFAQGYRELGARERARADGSGRELVVRIEARVDRARVAEALQRAGLLANVTPVAPEDGGTRVVVEPLPAWPALAAVERRLVELGARRVSPERAEPGRVVLTVESDHAVSALVARLVASPPPGVSVIPLGERDGAPAIRLEAAAAPSVGGAAPIDTPAAKR
jgi:hypothetical protein